MGGRSNRRSAASVAEAQEQLALAHTRAARVIREQDSNPAEVLQVLSASSYPYSPQPDGMMSSKVQLYGGLVYQESEDDDQENTLTSTKRRKISPNDEQDEAVVSSKKPRGRPKVYTKDETAAERRRTQIRLAQRAYRNRKDNTIVTLNKQVEQLQESANRMMQSFLTFSSKLDDIGIARSNARVAQQLQVTTQEFEQALQSATFDSDHESDKISHQVDEHEITTSSSNKSTSHELQQAQRPLSTASSSSNRAVEIDVEEYTAPLQSLYSPAESDALVTTSHNNASVLGFGSADEGAAPMYSDQVLTIERSFPVKDSYTYSFQETTFARRLHRFSLEHAFRNLCNPSLDPVVIAKSFRFCFSISNRPRLINAIRETLQRKAGESLENWDSPFFHVGGASTHYPRTDCHGAPVIVPNRYDPRTILEWDNLTGVPDPPAEVITQRTLECAGLGGDWFDSYEVEKYLNQRGIYLDGQSSYVDLDASGVDMQGLTTSPTITSTGTTLLPSPASLHTRSGTPEHATLLHRLGGYSVDSGRVMDALDFDELTTAQTSKDAVTRRSKSTPDVDLYVSGASNPGSMANDYTYTRRTIMFDVEKFLDRVLDGSSCLGRAPGFRKDSVDNALSAALQEVY